MQRRLGSLFRSQIAASSSHVRLDVPRGADAHHETVVLFGMDLGQSVQDSLAQPVSLEACLLSGVVFHVLL